LEEIIGSVGVFFILISAAFGVMWLCPRLPAHHRDDETNTIVRLIANIFAIMTSLVFGLMINSSKATYETIDRNVHSYATQIILLDRSLRTYGLGAVQARQSLKDYLAAAIDAPERANQAPGSRLAEQRLATIGDHLAMLQPADGYHLSLITEAQRQYRQIVEQRWSIVEQSEGIIPTPLIVMLIAWLTLIFASFGYRAPFNPVIAGMFVVSSGLVAASIYLVLDMDIPFAGAIQISDAPLKRALVQLEL
jgi:hypothetical protein